MNQTRLTLSHLPPSVNAIWRHAKGGKTYRTEAYMTWQNGEGYQVNRQLAGQHRFTGPVYVTIAMKRPRTNADLDNRIKGCLDLLQSCGAIADDKLVMGINVFWSVILPENVAAEIIIAQAEALAAA